jgi:DNA-directed RNA polymerase subunit RPC12/RpoP
MPTIVMKKCPECGARFQLDTASDHAKCSYCGTISRIESKKPKGPPPDNKPAEPIIYLSSGFRGAWVFSTLMTLAIIGFSTWMVIRGLSGAIGGPGNTTVTISGPIARIANGQSLSEHMQWVGYSQPMLVDISGDGVMDVVGWIRFLNTDGTSYDHLAAFNAVTGDRMWDTGAIAETGQSHQCRAALSGDKLMVSDPTGVVRSFALVNGAPVWQTVVGERVERFCGGAPGQIVAELKDERALAITVATGQVTPAGKVERDTPCPPLQTNSTENGPFFTAGGGTWDENGIVNPTLEGMRVGKVLVDNATRNTIALGNRDPGTRSPMAALYRMTHPKKKKATALWMTGVSSQNPLTVEEGAPERGAISQGRVIVPYKLQGSKAGAKLSCLDEASGRILWDVPIPLSDSGSIGGLTASMHHVFVSHWTYLDIFQLADGAHKLTIGVW